MKHTLTIAAVSALAADFMHDAGRLGTSFAFGFITVLAMFVALLQYLNSGGNAETKGGFTRPLD